MRTLTTSNERGESLASSHHCHLFLQSFGFLIIWKIKKSSINDDTIEKNPQNKTETMTRSSTFLLLLLAPLSASAFTVLPSLRNPSTTAVFMSEAVETTGTNLVLTGNNIELTPALQEYAQKRIGGLLEKLGGGIVRECEVHLSVSKNPKVGTIPNRKRFVLDII